MLMVERGVKEERRGEKEEEREEGMLRDANGGRESRGEKEVG